MKKILALVLTAVLVLSLLPLAAAESAGDAAEEDTDITVIREDAQEGGEADDGDL